MACFDIYRDQLATLKHGYALWEPNPAGLYPSVEVGDVGFIRDGLFHRLFNVLLHANDPSQGRGVPEDFEPLYLDEPKVYHRDLPMGLYTTRSVFAVSAGAQVNSPSPLPISGEMSLTCSQQQGAVLAIPDHALREDAYHMGIFLRYITENCDSWTAFSKQLGLGLRMEDLILVTGRDLTSSWAVAAFTESHADARLTLGPNSALISGSASLNVVWTEGSHVHHNHGPLTRRLAPGMTKIDPNRKDQCIFIRGFRAKRRLFLRSPKVLKAAAEPRDDSDHDSSDADASMLNLLSPHWDDSLSPSGSFDVGSYEVGSGAGDILLESLAGASQAAPDMTMAVLDYILDTSPRDIAVVHDSQLYPFLEQTNLQVPGFDSFRSMLSHVHPPTFMLDGGAASIELGAIFPDGPEPSCGANEFQELYDFLVYDNAVYNDQIIGFSPMPHVSSGSIPQEDSSRYWALLNSRPPTPALTDGTLSTNPSPPVTNPFPFTPTPASLVYSISAQRGQQHPDQKRPIDEEEWLFNPLDIAGDGPPPFG